MKTLRRLALATLGVAYLHLVFGAIVRITGSGMGCGDHWPRCHGLWFPPYDRPDLIIEITHRHLAVLLGIASLGLLAAAWRRRAEPRVGGRGGVLRAAAGATLVVILTGGFGALTVFYGNPWWATAIHWTMAMVVLALLTAAAIRAGALGGGEAACETAGGKPASAKTVRVAMIAAVMAFVIVVFGGLTAKFPTANVACLSFPHCGENPGAMQGASHLHMTHRYLAFLLFFHLLGAFFAVRKRAENPTVTRWVAITFAAVGVQMLVAGALIGMKLPAFLRSLHEAVGVAIWLAAFALVYLARRSRAPVT